MTMTETEELKWLRVLFIEDSPIECSAPDCHLEAKWRHTCPACGYERFRCSRNSHYRLNGVPVSSGPGNFITDVQGCGTEFTYDEWFSRYYPI